MDWLVMIELPRRRFLQVLTGLVAAPAVVKADNLMKVFALPKPQLIYSNRTIRYALPQGSWRMINSGDIRAFLRNDIFDDIPYIEVAGTQSPDSKNLWQVSWEKPTEALHP